MERQIRKAGILETNLILGKDREAEHGCRAGCGARLRGTHGPGE